MLLASPEFRSLGNRIPFLDQPEAIAVIIYGYATNDRLVAVPDRFTWCYLILQRARIVLDRDNQRLAYSYTGDFKFEGNATIKGQLLSEEEYQKQNTSLTWDMPEKVVLSGSHVVTDRLNFYWDFERVFFDDFESTDLDIDGYPLLVIDRNFKDANRYAIGAEYALNNRMTLQLGLSLDESPVDDSDRMPDIPVEEIIKTSVGVIYEVNDNLVVHGYGIVEFLGDGEIQQLASINGEKLGESFEMDTDAKIYVVGASFTYKF